MSTDSALIPTLTRHDEVFRLDLGGGENRIDEGLVDAVLVR